MGLHLLVTESRDSICPRYCYEAKKGKFEHLQMEAFNALESAFAHRKDYFWFKEFDILFI